MSRSEERRTKAWRAHVGAHQRGVLSPQEGLGVGSGIRTSRQYYMCAPSHHTPRCGGLCKASEAADPGQAGPQGCACTFDIMVDALVPTTLCSSDF